MLSSWSITASTSSRGRNRTWFFVVAELRLKVMVVLRFVSCWVNNGCWSLWCLA